MYVFLLEKVIVYPEENEIEESVVRELEKKGEGETESDGIRDSVDRLDVEGLPEEVRLLTGGFDLDGEPESTLESDGLDVIENRIEFVLGGVNDSEL
ncbi:MAG: hypothetical protein EBZ77_17215 [Chitinophagia bacterium]|nr:hypothetical protein [Chitinophagia bacterium]